MLNEKQNYEGPYAERLNEIDKRIEDLKEHRRMYVNSGGQGLRMAVQVDNDIYELREEKIRIMNGTQEKIDKLEKKINELKLLKNQCKMINFIKKMKINKEVYEYEEEMEQILKRR